MRPTARDKTGGYAGQLIDRLNEHCGAERVFFDLQTLEPGVDWVESLERALDECEMLTPNLLEGVASGGEQVVCQRAGL